MRFFKEIKTKKKCSYGCGRYARFSFKNGDICCNKMASNCLAIRKDKDSKIMTRSFNLFLDRARKIYNSKFDYSKAVYNGQMNKIEIICPTHGSFMQSPWHHAGKRKYESFVKGKIKNVYGCWQCAMDERTSSGTDQIREFLSFNRIAFVNEKRFNDFKYSNGWFIRFDFYLPEFNILIEFDGQHHFKPVKWNTKTTDAEAKENLKIIKQKDKLRNIYAKKKNITLLRISYFENVQDKLTEFFTKKKISLADRPKEFNIKQA